jgi:hypothetical protein
MNRRGGGCHRPTGAGAARAPTTARPWHGHGRQTARHHVGFLTGPRCSGSIRLREQLPVRGLAPYNFHRLAVRDVVRG